MRKSEKTTLKKVVFYLKKQPEICIKKNLYTFAVSKYVLINLIKIVD